MALIKLNCMYGHLEGIEPKVAREVTGYLSIDAGIYAKHGESKAFLIIQIAVTCRFRSPCPGAMAYSASL